MTRTLTISSARGGSLDLLRDPYFDIVEFEAETSIDAVISTTTIAGYDGDIYNSAQTQPRSARIELYIRGGANVEAAKRHICQVIKPKQLCTFHMSRGERDIELAGYVEQISMPRYTNAVSFTATFHCSQPYWQDAVEVIKTLSGVENLHYFTSDPQGELYFTEAGVPFGVYDFARERTYTNEGDVEVGMEIRINAVGAVTNPVIYAEDGTYIGVNTTMQAHDVVSITTHRGNKTIKKNGVSILDNVMSGSTWLQLHTGDNTFNINSDETSTDNMYFELIYKQRYV